MFFDTNIRKHDRDIWLLLDGSRVYAPQKSHLTQPDFAQMLKFDYLQSGDIGFQC